MMNIEKLQEKLKKRPEVLASSANLDCLSVEIQYHLIVPFLIYLRDDPSLKFIQMTDLCAVDYPEREKRFEIVYHLMSYHFNVRLRIKASVLESDIVPSVTSVYPAAGWYEREVFDMFGIAFSGNDDMRRILTDYSFSGYPLRKDFPTTGYVELRYDTELKRVVYEPVKLTQDFRQFDFLSPWEGMIQKLPGDEKADKGM